MIILAICAATQAVLTINPDRRHCDQNWLGLPQIDDRDPSRSLEAKTGLHIKNNNLERAGAHAEIPIMRVSLPADARFWSTVVNWEPAAQVSARLPNANARKMLRRALEQ